MRKSLLCILLFLGLGSPAHSQDGDFHRTLSVEIGSGILPPHQLFGGVTPDLEKGQSMEWEGLYRPRFDLSFVWASSEHTEWVLKGGLSWWRHRMIQYATFGTDPNGNPRYDLENKTRLGWTDSRVSPTLSFSWRPLWLRRDGFTLYSELGLGFILEKGPYCYPGVTFVGARYNLRLFYFYAESTLSPVATLLHGGIGWRF